MPCGRGDPPFGRRDGAGGATIAAVTGGAPLWMQSSAAGASSGAEPDVDFRLCRGFFPDRIVCPVDGELAVWRIDSTHNGHLAGLVFA
jgi:hypothetical protein